MLKKQQGEWQSREKEALERCQELEGLGEAMQVDLETAQEELQKLVQSRSFISLHLQLQVSFICLSVCLSIYLFFIIYCVYSCHLGKRLKSRTCSVVLNHKLRHNMNWRKILTT